MVECTSASVRQTCKGAHSMLIDRYAPEDVFARVPELADQTDPVLLERDHLLDDDTLYQQVRRDLAHRSRLTPVHGRHSTPAEVLMRLLVVQHLYACMPGATTTPSHESPIPWSSAASAASTSTTFPSRRRSS